MSLSVNDETVSFSLEVNVDEALTELRKVQTLLYRAIGLLRRMGLPEQVDAAIAKIQRLIAIINALRLAMIALQAASGPIGWALAGIGVAATAVTAYEFHQELVHDRWYDETRGR